ncbi:class I SAM-dependent methyltransferase [Micromonospora sp. URMC 105]|uniref:class I SAM-dependent methyltransferase n=1 Tax=Micromonospora sp. URMC 105 TaxID=3423413 RepID=UPI003F1AB845
MTGGRRPGALLSTAALERSAVVANNAMNRERQLAGVNSYARELGFNPVDVLTDRLAGAAATAGWLDLCCGTGRALIQAAGQLRRMGLAERTALVGVDLVDAFDPAPTRPANLRLVCASVATWAPARPFDLITCLHGLHYVGDKLAVLARAADWLTPEGRFVADLDLSSIRLADGRPAGRRLTALLRAAGFSYDPRRRRISRTGRREVHLPYRFLGADDRAGPNYTGQPAVHSHYAEDC